MTAVDARPREGTPAWRLMLAAALVQVRIVQRNPASVIVLVLQPAVFALLGLLAAPPEQRADPGFVTEVVAGSTFVAVWAATLWTSGQVVRRDRREGTIVTAGWSGASLPLVFLGRALGATAVSMLGAASASVASTLLLGGNVVVSRPLVVLAACALTTANVACLGFLVGTMFVASRAAPRLAEALTYPVFILGGFYIPLELLPGPLQVVSTVLGPYWGGRLLQSGLVGDPVEVIDAVMVVVTGLAYLGLGVWAFRVVLRRASDRGSLDLY